MTYCCCLGNKIILAIFVKSPHNFGFSLEYIRNLNWLFPTAVFGPFSSADDSLFIFAWTQKKLYDVSALVEKRHWKREWPKNCDELISSNSTTFSNLFWFWNSLFLHNNSLVILIYHAIIATFLVCTLLVNEMILLIARFFHLKKSSPHLFKVIHWFWWFFSHNFSDHTFPINYACFWSRMKGLYWILIYANYKNWRFTRENWIDVKMFVRCVSLLQCFFVCGFFAAKWTTSSSPFRLLVSTFLSFFTTLSRRFQIYVFCVNILRAYLYFLLIYLLIKSNSCFAKNFAPLFLTDFW